tara:strand:- start:56 stop:466 length:411 start_codon:yes stop_codon:yes gene_type:complete
MTNSIQQLSQETLELIDELQESYDLTENELLDYIKVYGEEAFNDCGEIYYKLLEEDSSKVEAWLKIFQMADIEFLEENYHGKWDSGADFAESICEECGYIPRDLPTWIKIDWEETWKDGLSWDYSIQDGHVFRTSW